MKTHKKQGNNNNDPDEVSNGKQAARNFHKGRRTKTRRAGKLYRDRSRLYRSRILELNTSTHVKALVEIYTTHAFALLSNLKLFF